MSTRAVYIERVLNEVYPVRGRDEKIDPREIIAALDDWVNENAKAGFLLNMKMGFGPHISDQFVTTFEWLTITDPANKVPSYVAIPANYADLPNNMGIQEVYFENSFTSPTKKYYDPVIIRRSAAQSESRGSMASELEGRLSVSVRNGNLVFNKGLIAARYGNVGIRLVVRDSSQILDTAPYPVPSDLVNQMIADVADRLRQRRLSPVDLLKDNNDKP